MTNKDIEALKEINESVDDMVGQMAINTINFLDWESYFQEYSKLKRVIKTTNSPNCKSVLKAITTKLAIALRDAHVLLITDDFEASYNGYKKELLTDLNDARKVLA